MAYTLDEFKKEGIKGSHLTCINALKILREYIKEYNGSDLIALGEDLNKTVRSIIKTYPNMVILRKNVTSVVYYLKRLVKAEKSATEVKKQSLAKINEIVNDLEQKKKKIGESGTKLILNQSKIVTISYSSNLIDIFKQALKLRRKFSVYCLESRPSLEGQVFAEELGSLGVQAQIITDAAVGQIMQNVNMVLTGADRVYEQGFVSKTGSLPLAVLAKTFQVPMYIAFETDKILFEYEQALRFYEENPREVYSGKKKNVSASNIYFDSVPLEYISKVICEDGIFSITEFKKWYLEE
jgi:translation initiation factor eIF-2B subunit alpha